MQTITIELTDTQYKGLQYAALSPEEWADNVVTDRARIANDEIIKIYMERALDEGIQMPITREAIIEDAFTRGWVMAAAERNEVNPSVQLEEA
jgi:hypothetical protein